MYESSLFGAQNRYIEATKYALESHISTPAPHDTEPMTKEQTFKYYIIDQTVY